jgi:hypothetical protein
VFETMAEGKLDWQLIAPFLDAARSICRADFRQGAQIRLHSIRTDGEQWQEAEEAFLGIAIRDRDDGQPWLSETYWVSDIVMADRDREQARRTVAALERSIAKVRSWLAEEEEGGASGSV